MLLKKKRLYYIIDNADIYSDSDEKILEKNQIKKN